MPTYLESLKEGVIKDTDFYSNFNQCRMLNYAAEKNLELFQEIAYKPISSTKNHLSQMGLFSASLLLRAAAIENIIKARILFIMKEKDTLSKYSSLNNLIKKEWKEGKKGISHDPIKLCEKYSISLNPIEKEFIKNHLDHMDWAGRFPLPKNINNIKSEQSLGGTQNEDMNKLILRFANEMSLNLDHL